jgi:hypothetical protein
MSPLDIPKALHDLRAYLARAKTLAKLLAEARPEDIPGQVAELLVELDELDLRLRNFNQSDIPPR